jgi:phosphate transport system substrate-binding protein
VSAAGSSALLPLAKAAAEKFESAHPDVTVEVSAGGSGQGLAQVEQGAVDIGDSDIPPPPEMTDLVDHKVAVVVFAVVANPGPFNDKVTSLTKDQVVGIFSGAITNWKDVGGGDQPITVLNRPDNSGTKKVFVSVIMGTTALAAGTPVEDNSGTIRQTLATVAGSISYLATPYVDNTVKALALDGVDGTGDNVSAGKYPFYSFEHMFTKGAAAGSVKDFLDYMASDDVQNNVVVPAHYLRADAVK